MRRLDLMLLHKRTPRPFAGSPPSTPTLWADSGIDPERINHFPSRGSLMCQDSVTGAHLTVKYYKSGVQLRFPDPNFFTKATTAGLTDKTVVFTRPL